MRNSTIRSFRTIFSYMIMINQSEVIEKPFRFCHKTKQKKRRRNRRTFASNSGFLSITEINFPKIIISSISEIKHIHQVFNYYYYDVYLNIDIKELNFFLFCYFVFFSFSLRGIASEEKVKNKSSNLDCFSFFICSND